MGNLTLVPVSGLGNRMRAMASAISLARQENISVRIVWQATKDCNARFGDLFKPLCFSPAVNLDEGGFADTPATRYNLWMPRLLRVGRYSAQSSYYRPHADLPARELLQKGDVYLACAYSVAHYTPEILHKIFSPIPLLSEKIDKTVATFTPKTVGVHIRRTDNVQAINESTLPAFEEAMHEMLDANLADRFFLCSDDESVKEHMQSVFGNRIITRSVKVRRDETESIQDAVIDLWALSKTFHILGSYYSSFTDMAAELGQATLQVVHKH